MLALLGAACLLRAEPGGISLGGGAPAASRVKTEIVADAAAFTAGRPFLVAVTLTTNLAWHIYWSNPGDAGVATSFEWKSPAGFVIEPEPFPVPTAFVQPGDIRVLGYEGKTTFLFRVTPSAAGAGTEPQKLAVTANWLVCNKDQCVPGKTTLEVALPPDAEHTAKPDFLTAAQEFIPTATPSTDFVSSVGTPKAIDGAPEKWRVQIGWKKIPKIVEAFPAGVEGLDMSITQASTSGDTTVVEFKSHVYAGQKVKEEKIPLLIAYAGEDGKRRSFFVNLDAAAIGARQKQ